MRPSRPGGAEKYIHRRGEGETGKIMLVGIMADTHDCLPMIARAVLVLNEAGVDLVLHAGDYVSPFVVPELQALEADLIGILGNNDGDRAMLTERFSDFDTMQLRGTFAEVMVDDTTIGMVHGHEQELLTALMESEAFDILAYGHTHHHEIYRVGTTLVVNPGEVCGYLSGIPTVAVVDTEMREAEILYL